MATMTRRQMLLSAAVTAVSPRFARSQPALRAFNMVVLGDSIMWGQGLPQDQKFSTLVQNWLAKWVAPRPVQRFVFAHSGARIAPTGNDTGPDLSNGPAAFVGEVPDPSPSILSQIELALNRLPQLGVAQPSDVDLVLVDGGI